MSVIDDVVDREGGFVHHPADRGKATKFGVTQATLSAWLGRSATVEDIQALTLPQAKEVLHEVFVVRPGFDKLPENVIKWHLVDFGVHSSAETAIRIAQDLLGLETDGILGPKTLAALTALDPATFNLALIRRRLKFLSRIVQRDTTQAVFFPGWVDRVLGFFSTS